MGLRNTFPYQVFCPTKDLTWRTCKFLDCNSIQTIHVLISGTWLKECLMKAGFEDVSVEFITGSSSASGKEKAMSNFRSK